MNARWRCLVLLVVGLFFGRGELRGQGVSVGGFGGFADLTKGSDDPVSSWGGGWTAGGGIEVMPLSFLGITAQVGHYRFNHRGGTTEIPGGFVRGESGDPMTTTELAAGLRFYIGPFFLQFQAGKYTMKFGETTLRYAVDSTSPELTSIGPASTRKADGTALELGLSFEIFKGLWIAPGIRFAMISGVSPTMSSGFLSVKQEVVGW